MPGRYSHSVVLAGYSSQGIINLPNDKHVEYLRTSPFAGPPRVKSNSNFKSSGNAELHQRSQSAMAIRSGRWTPAPDSPASPTRRWFINGDSEQPVRNTSAVHDTTATPTYKPRRSIDAQNLDKDPTPPPRSHSVLGTASETAYQQPVRPSQSSIATKPASNTPSERPLQPSRSSSEIRNRAANAAAALLQKASERREGATTPSRQPATKTMSTAVETPQTDRLRHHRLHQPSSNAVMQSHVQEPIKELDEPDFDDFTDTNATQTSYFPQPSTTTPKGVSATTPVLTEKAPKTETRLSSNIMSRSRQSYDQNFHVPPSPRSEHNTNFISEDSGSKLNSMSSISSIGSSIAHSTRRSTKPVDNKKSVAQTSTTQWGLPEIEEDGVFGPEIFAQDLDNDLDPDSSSPEFGESSFGMISSGRDVDFHADDDTLSDSASACPPDIGRYRDEVESAPSQFASRLKSEDSRAASPGLLSNKSKKGFLSRLKAKRSWV